MKSKANKNIAFLPVIILLAVVFYGCGKKLPDDRPAGIKPVQLLNQDSSRVNFPSEFKGKVLLLSFIYTNCPDICPMTTHNMQMIQERLKKENINYVRFAEMSFDPARDTPHILKEFGDIRNIDYKNFTFLTGKEQEIKTILTEMNILAIQGDTTKAENGSIMYFFTHTDRITLIDKEGKIRNEYRGSKTNIQEIINDIKILGD
jgi:protein SCO1